MSITRPLHILDIFHNYNIAMSTLNFDQILKELEWQFSRSSGPGGQHVNTTDTKAKLLWLFTQSKILKPYQISQIQKNLKNYLNKSKTSLQLSCGSSRSKERNKQDCINRLKSLLENKAFIEPKKRHPTKPTRSSINKRLDSKKKASQRKNSRKKVEF